MSNYLETMTTRRAKVVDISDIENTTLSSLKELITTEFGLKKKSKDFKDFDSQNLDSRLSLIEIKIDTFGRINSQV